MNEELQSAESVRGLLDLTSLAINRDRLDDARALLTCLRELRPGLAELVIFDAWIAIKRHAFADAITLLQSMSSTSPTWWMARGLLVLCQFAIGHVAWIETAIDVREHGDSPQAAALVDLLLAPKEEAVEA